LEKTNQEHIAQ